MSKVTISDVAEAVTALDKEIREGEAKQLQLAADMHELMRLQVMVAVRMRALHRTLELLLESHSG